MYDADKGVLLAAGKAPVAENAYNAQVRWAPKGNRLLVTVFVTPAGWTASGRWSFFSVDGASGDVLAEMKLEPSERLTLTPQWSPGGDLVVAPVWNTLRKTSGAGATPPVRLVVWDPVSGRRLGTLGGGMNGASWDLAWSRDGKTIAVASQDRVVRLWDVAALKPGSDETAVAALGVTRVLEGHAGDAGPGPASDNSYYSTLVYGAPPFFNTGLLRAGWRPDGRLVATAAILSNPQDRPRRPSGASTCGTRRRA